MADELEGKHGVQSLEVGMGILRAMVGGYRSMMLKDIAAATGMPASKVHRYLVSLIRSGMVEQDPLTSRYDLGPFALNIGLVAIDRIDRIRLGVAAIAQLRDRINQTTALAVWSDKGPVIVRWERPRRPITVNVVTGTALDVLTSASGRIFAAFLPRKTVKSVIEREMKTLELPAELKSWEGVEAMLARVRGERMAYVAGYHLVPGVEAVAAPVFNFDGEISMAMLVVAVQGTLDLSPQGDVLTALNGAVAELSERLGAKQGGGE